MLYAESRAIPPMRYSLIDIVACAHCHGELACWTHAELTAPVPAGPWRPGTRVSAGPGLGPVASPGEGEHARILQRCASAPADSQRNFEVEVAEGLLLCGGCGRWYPIDGQIPEILPDHLRDGSRDAAIFQRSAAAMPPELRAAFQRFSPSTASTDAGMHHKVAEISIKAKIDDPTFFGPGYSAPFNPWNTSFTLYLITLLGNVTPLLALTKDDVVIDSGCGYAWTTEWFHRSGVDVIGVDICRTYLEIAVARMGVSRPQLVVADVENLPIRSGVANAVMAYESFHHLPDRQAAMRSYDRALAPGGRVVLAEPGAAHEAAPVSVDVMAKYGILEKGMELEDVIGYAAGTQLRSAEQHFVVRARASEFVAVFDPAFVEHHTVVEGNLFTLVKGPVAPAPHVPRGLWAKTRRRVKIFVLRQVLER